MLTLYLYRYICICILIFLYLHLDIFVFVSWYFCICILISLYLYFDIFVFLDDTKQGWVHCMKAPNLVPECCKRCNPPNVVYICGVQCEFMEKKCTRNTEKTMSSGLPGSEISKIAWWGTVLVHPVMRPMFALAYFIFFLFVYLYQDIFVFISWYPCICILISS